MMKINVLSSQVHPEWYGWLHYKTDCLPCEDPAKMEMACCGWYSCWLLPYEENWSGTMMSYQPYSTIPARVHCWDGKDFICVAFFFLSYRGQLPTAELESDTLSWVDMTWLAKSSAVKIVIITSCSGAGNRWERGALVGFYRTWRHRTKLDNFCLFVP